MPPGLILRATFLDFGPIRIFSLLVPRSCVVFFVSELLNGLLLLLLFFRISSQGVIVMSTTMGDSSTFFFL